MKSKELPQHIAIIMDGNGRWAERQGKIRSAGHSRGVEVIDEIATYAFSHGLKYLTVFAFSTENWKRSEKEVGVLLKLLNKYVIDSLKKLTKRNVRIKFVGDISVLDKKTLELMKECEEKSRDLTGGQLNICFNYGGRHEIIKAVNEISASGEQVDEEGFKKHLYLNEEPDPEIIIRTGGEHRISNFLLYEMAYSEIYFLNILWPDFTPDDLNRVIEDYMNTDRRFGGTK